MLRNVIIPVILVCCVACGPDAPTKSTGDSQQQDLASCPQACPSSCPTGQVCLTDGDGCMGCYQVPGVGTPECAEDSDCQGPLPKICRVCDDGAAGCAHWTCVSGTCFATTCG
jgi:hypothetical protein